MSDTPSLDAAIHFPLSELVVTSRKGPDGNLLPNQPDAAALSCLLDLREGMLEPIRNLWGCPVRVTSAYRSHDVEMAVSGKDYGQHRLGQAADLQPIGDLNIVEAYEMIWNSPLPYDQLILEQSGTARWIHVSYVKGRDPRHMALYSPDAKSYAYYKPGVLT
jgi:hypothetical protein